VPPPIVAGYIAWTDSAGNLWHYKIVKWDWQHPGFPNAYLALYCIQCSPTGVIIDLGR
jgi:hypothetical protein